MEHHKISISGMSCTGCEKILQRAVSALDAVKSVQADYQKNEMQVDFVPPCSLEQIYAAVREAGYEAVQRPQKDHSAAYILIILLGLYVIARQLGWTDIFQSFPVISSGEQIGYVVLFGIGLLTSVHCIAMCGGINLSQSVSGQQKRPFYNSVLYNLGRLISYTLIGGILGLIGEAAAITLRVRGMIGLAAGVCMVLMGINMLGSFRLLRRLSLRLPKPVARALGSFSRYGPLAVGLVNGLMPCGPLQSMQLYAIASGSLLSGALSMFCFCLGTVPLMLLFGGVAKVCRSAGKKRC